MKWRFSCVNPGPEYTLPQQETEHCGASPRPRSGLPIPCSSRTLKIVSEAWHCIRSLQCLSISLSGVSCYLGLFWAILVSFAPSLWLPSESSYTQGSRGVEWIGEDPGALGVTLPLTVCKAAGKLFDVFTSASSLVSWKSHGPSGIAERIKWTV